MYIEVIHTLMVKSIDETQSESHFAYMNSIVLVYRGHSHTNGWIDWWNAIRISFCLHELTWIRFKKLVLRICFVNNEWFAVSSVSQQMSPEAKWENIECIILFLFSRSDGIVRKICTQIVCDFHSLPSLRENRDDIYPTCEQVKKKKILLHGVFLCIFWFRFKSVALKAKTSYGHAIALWKKRCGIDQKRLII